MTITSRLGTVTLAGLIGMGCTSKPNEEKTSQLTFVSPRESSIFYSDTSAPFVLLLQPSIEGSIDSLVLTTTNTKTNVKEIFYVPLTEITPKTGGERKVIELYGQNVGQQRKYIDVKFPEGDYITEAIVKINGQELRSAVKYSIRQ